MADIGYVQSVLGSLPPDVRQPLIEAFRYVLTNLVLGEPGEGKRSLTGAWVQRTVTTPAAANTAFSIVHGLGSIPTAVYPVLFCDRVSAQIVPLTITQAADAQRVYLKSSSTGASITVWIEP